MLKKFMFYLLCFSCDDIPGRATEQSRVAAVDGLGTCRLRGVLRHRPPPPLCESNKT